MEKQVVYIEIESSDPEACIENAIRETVITAWMKFVMLTKVQVVDQILANPWAYAGTLFLIRWDTSEDTEGKPLNSVKDLAHAIWLRVKESTVVILSSWIDDDRTNIPEGITVLVEWSNSWLSEAIQKFGGQANAK